MTWQPTIAKSIMGHIWREEPFHPRPDVVEGLPSLKTCNLQLNGILTRENQTTVHVTVRDNNVDQALKALKKKLQREGVFREMKLRRAYEKPSERKAREKAEAVRRARKLERKRIEREGF